VTRDEHGGRPEADRADKAAEAADGDREEKAPPSDEITLMELASRPSPP
jgi:hypothetical protein